MTAGSEDYGRYTLLSRIDVGGMAEVFKALQRGPVGFERLVAIKRLHPHCSVDEELVRMFIDEARLTVQLSHANIAHIYDLDIIDQTYFLSMEFIDGHSVRSLWQRMNAQGERLPLGAVYQIADRVAAALHYAHFAEDIYGRPLGIIHRDVSPQNVLVSFRGDIKVIDFGLAKAAHRLVQTRAGIVKGKVAYLSPEQAFGKPIDLRSDLYALGILLWELLTGQRAFARTSDQESVLAIRRGELAPPSTFVSVPAPLEETVMRLLAPSPADRFRTALEFRDHLAATRHLVGSRFDQRDMTALMRATFPERRDEEREVTGTIDLVKRKPAAPAAPGVRARSRRPRSHPPVAPDRWSNDVTEEFVRESETVVEPAERDPDTEPGLTLPNDD